MTQVAGIRPGGRGIGRDARAVDAMCANRFEQCERRVGHVAIQARTARRLRLMMRVFRQVCRVLMLLVALHARLIGLFARDELIVWITSVHRMTRQAGQVAALEASGRRHRQMLAATDTIVPVGPIALREELRLSFFRLSAGECEMVL